MAGVPFLYINIIAFCFYLLFLSAFLAAKKTREVIGFVRILGMFSIWSGASILMRLKIWPGLDFWFYVSLLALFGVVYIIYLFVCDFAHYKQPKITAIWGIATLVILVLTAMGVFLKPPVEVITKLGKVFTYDMEWQIAIPYVFLMAEVVSIARIFYRLTRKGTHAPGVNAVILGCVVIGIGNIIQIMPGNIFPWDQVSGIIMVIALAIGLYRKRIFVMTLRVSQNVILAITFIIGIIIMSMCVSPLKELIFDAGGLNATYTILIIVIISICFIYVLKRIMAKILSNLFNLDNSQEAYLNNFSEKISRSLNTNEIASELAAVIKKMVSAKKAFVCIREGDYFVIKGETNSLYSKNIRFSVNGPFETLLRQSEGYIIIDEFRNSILYKSMWESEKKLIQKLGIVCIASLREKDDIIGIVGISEKERKSVFSGADVNNIRTACSIASIAIKNASLYEQMYREARIDSLTGVYNYRAFMEISEEMFEQYGSQALALIYINIDDFKLYNQLYGTLEGDYVLKCIATAIKTCIGNNGKVFRTGGKIFAILLPLCDVRKAQAYTEEIRGLVYSINGKNERAGYRPLTISAGICVSPFGASNVRELIANADLATFAAKESGKDKIIIRHEKAHSKISLIEYVHTIVEVQDPAFEQNLPIINALTAAIDAKDHYTCKHSNNVAEYAAILAASINLSEDEIRIVYGAGLLHDIGKISISESILGKTSALTDSEYETMKGHVNNSIEMIRHLPAMDYLTPAVIGHHERWDGRGYPRGLKGEEIPLYARCLAVADMFDAMTTDRPYRKGLPLSVVREEILRSSGTQLDPMLAERFVELIDSEEIKVRDSVID